MNFLESLLVLLLAAIMMLQVSRRLALPYPAMLAAAGVVVALIPGTPDIPIEAETALALFIAPALLDSAFDFPIAAARRFWAPLFVFAVVAVLVTTGVVAWIGWALAGLPLAAAIALGAIVAPPDAAAANAVLGSLSIPRNADAVLKGESLFNDATALLLFGAALAIQSHGGLDPGVGVRLALAVPGGILLGILSAALMQRLNAFVTGTLGGNLLQFVTTILLWIIAEKLQLSAVLCIVAFAMAMSRSSEINASPRMRVHSYAVWSAVVFVLNVFAFLLMGMQARTIVARMSPDHLREALGFAGIVIVAVIIVRLAIVLAFNRLNARRHRRRGEAEPATWQQAVLVGWSGMRGLVTLATAFALPAVFPQRDLVVLTAFGVVLATLVVQGLTMTPLIRLLGLSQQVAAARALADARAELSGAALATLDGQQGPEAAYLRYGFTIQRAAMLDPPEATALERMRALGLAALAAARTRLEALRTENAISLEAYGLLQEELDWRELSLLPEDARTIVEG
jgi:CPA1 family monovalent cation:H+ antiporter